MSHVESDPEECIFHCTLPWRDDDLNELIQPCDAIMSLSREYIDIYLSISISVYLSIYLSAIYIYICIYIYIHIYIYIYNIYILYIIYFKRIYQDLFDGQIYIYNLIYRFSDNFSGITLLHQFFLNYRALMCIYV